MSNADNFILWYSKRINNTNLVVAKNKLLSMRSNNPEMYQFLINEYNLAQKGGSVQSLPTKMKLKYNIPDYNDTFMASEYNIPSEYRGQKCKIVTEMDSEYNIPEDNESSDNYVTLTNMESHYNIRPKRTSKPKKGYK